VWIELYKFHFLFRQTGAGPTYLNLSPSLFNFQNYLSLPKIKKMTSELAFEQIKGDYWYAAYGEFKVIIDKSNGFVNATKLCADGGKHFYDWTRNQTGRQLIHALEFLNSNTMALENSHCEGNTLRDTPWKFPVGYVNTLQLTAVQMLIV
jgi:hypothetical protein